MRDFRTSRTMRDQFPPFGNDRPVKVRRAGARWRVEAPPYVVDCFDDDRSIDRYSVLIALGDCLAWLGMSGAPEHPQGFSQWSETTPHAAARYRREEGHHRVRWLDLPPEIRLHVERRVLNDRTSAPYGMFEACSGQSGLGVLKYPRKNDWGVGCSDVPSWRLQGANGRQLLYPSHAAAKRIADLLNIGARQPWPRVALPPLDDYREEACAGIFGRLAEEVK